MAAKKATSIKTAIINASPARIMEGLRALDQIEKLGGMAKLKKAMKLLVVIERFVKSNGRFKKKYTRTTKKKPAEQ